jgi:hypothetical protein
LMVLAVNILQNTRINVAYLRSICKAIQVHDTFSVSDGCQ